MKFVSLLFIALLFQSVGWAQSEDVCTSYVKIVDEMKFQRLAFSAKECMLSASPRAASQRYRSYIFLTDGKLLVFESYNGSRSSDATASKVYHFFPRNRQPDIIVGNGRVEVLTANSQVSFKFDTQRVSLLEMTSADLKVSSAIDAGNVGGIQINNANVLVLESGSKKGSDPTGNPSGKSTFRDSRGNTCTVTNSQVFKYTKDGDSTIRFTDNQLKDFLSERCPSLQ